MRSNQWYIIGIFLIVMSSWFVIIDMKYNCLKFSEVEQPIDRLDIYECVNSEILDPLIWLLFPLGWIFIICGWIESHSKKKEEKIDLAKSLQKLLDLSDEKFVRQMIRKYNLKESVKDIEELKEISKKDRKNEEKIKDEIEKYFKNTKEMRESFLNNLMKGFS